MSDPIRLKICPACGTGIPEEAADCPECGARQADERAGREGRRVEDPLGALFGDARERRAGTGALLRPWLQQNLGCLIPALGLVFGMPLLLGALLGNPLGGLAIPLIGIGIAGLVLTGVLIWLLWPTR